VVGRVIRSTCDDVSLDRSGPPNPRPALTKRTRGAPYPVSGHLQRPTALNHSRGPNIPAKYEKKNARINSSTQEVRKQEGCERYRMTPMLSPLIPPSAAMLLYERGADHNQLVFVRMLAFSVKILISTVYMKAETKNPLSGLLKYPCKTKRRETAT